jgi:hypothetical protein
MEIWKKMLKQIYHLYLQNSTYVKEFTHGLFIVLHCQSIYGTQHGRNTKNLFLKFVGSAHERDLIYSR